MRERLPYLPWNWSPERETRPCFTDDDTSLTYEQFAGRVDVVAAQLRSHGLGPGDVVAVMLPNRVELVLVLFAARRLGATATPVNPAFTAREAEHRVRPQKAPVILVLLPYSEAATAQSRSVAFPLGRLRDVAVSPTPPPSWVVVFARSDGTIFPMALRGSASTYRNCFGCL